MNVRIRPQLAGIQTTETGMRDKAMPRNRAKKEIERTEYLDRARSARKLRLTLASARLLSETVDRCKSAPPEMRAETDLRTSEVCGPPSSRAARERALRVAC
jgi:hypothetical protein